MIKIIFSVVILEQKRIDVFFTSIDWGDLPLGIRPGDPVARRKGRLLVCRIGQIIPSALLQDLGRPEAPLAEDPMSAFQDQVRVLGLDALPMLQIFRFQQGEAQGFDIAGAGHVVGAVFHENGRVGKIDLVVLSMTYACAGKRTEEKQFLHFSGLLCLGILVKASSSVCCPWSPHSSIHCFRALSSSSSFASYFLSEARFLRQ